MEERKRTDNSSDQKLLTTAKRVFDGVENTVGSVMAEYNHDDQPNTKQKKM